jgi:hypothetical protein
MSRVEDPNAKRADRMMGGLAASALALPPTLGVGMYMAGAHGLAIGFVTLVVVMAEGMLGSMFANAMTCVPTMRPAIGTDMQAMSTMLKRLRDVSRHGLPASERHEAQSEIGRASELLEQMLGCEPWVAVREFTAQEPKEHMRLRSEYINDHVEIGEWAARPNGTEDRPFRRHLASILPTLVAVMRDFGLDPGTFAPEARRLPGQDLGTPISLPMLAAPVRTLANEWLTGDNASVPMLERITADAAAGRELDALEAAWANARVSSAPEDVDEVDAQFLKGVDRISATLSEAVALRARRDRDVLSTNVRYLDAKLAS